GGVRAAQDGGERLLALRPGGAGGGEVALVDLARDVALVALDQQLQRRIGRFRGARRLGVRAADQRRAGERGGASAEKQATRKSPTQAKRAHDDSPVRSRQLSIRHWGGLAPTTT